MINTKIGSRWHYISRAHLQISLDPLLPIEQEIPRLSAYDRAYSGSHHVDLYYRPVCRWMMGHAVKAERKWLKGDMTCADLQAEFWLLLFKRLIAPSLLEFRLCEWRINKDVSRINSEGVGSGVRTKEFTPIPLSSSLCFPCSLTPSRRTPLSKRLEQAR